MSRFIGFMIAALLVPGLALAQTAQTAQTLSQDDVGTEPGAVPILNPLPASEIELDQFLWTQRPVVVFADSAADPRFRQQMDLLSDRIDALAARDVVVIVDTDPKANSPLRQKLRPRGFMLVLIGKDGGVKLRKPSPWDVRELSRSIDKMPLRQQEIRDRRAVTQ